MGLFNNEDSNSYDPTLLTSFDILFFIIQRGVAEETKLFVFK